MAMAVVVLAGAIASEVVGTLFLRASEGFSRLWPSVGTAVGYALAFGLLAQALESIDVGVADAVWAGVGTALITIIGIVALGEPATALKFAGTALIVVGVVALNLSGGAH
jgi:small multidrug resistance pump